MDFVFKFSFRKVTAREISTTNKLLKENPEESVDRFSELLAKTVIHAPEQLNGPVDNIDTWLDLPFWKDDPDELCFQDCVDALNDAMGKLGENMKKQ